MKICMQRCLPVSGFVSFYICVWLKVTLDTRPPCLQYRASWLWRNIIWKRNAYLWPLCGIVSEFYWSSTAMCWYPHWPKHLSPTISLFARFKFKNWTHLTNIFLLFPSLNNIITFFISLLFLFSPLLYFHLTAIFPTYLTKLIYLIINIKEADVTTASGDKAIEGGKTRMGIIYQNFLILWNLNHPPKSWTFWEILIEGFVWDIFSMNSTSFCYTVLLTSTKYFSSNFWK